MLVQHKYKLRVIYRLSKYAHSMPRSIADMPIQFLAYCPSPYNSILVSHLVVATGCRRPTKKGKIYSLPGVNN